MPVSPASTYLLVLGDPLVLVVCSARLLVLVELLALGALAMRTKPVG